MEIYDKEGNHLLGVGGICKKGEVYIDLQNEKATMTQRKFLDRIKWDIEQKKRAIKNKKNNIEL